MAYKASKSQSQGRPGYSISFRHPLRNDKNGKPGLKIRRGLNTADPEQADLMVAQMNAILEDESWWNANKRTEAVASFQDAVVDAFFDEIQAGRHDTENIRNELLPMPTKADGYAKVLFVGTTGAGKTSLLRHFIGSDSSEDRFPSTSTAKTTVSDIEVIPANGNYKAVITFFSEFLVQANVEDCVLNACTAVWERNNDDKIADRFLHHPDQRFRLSYTLGSWKANPSPQDVEDDWAFDGDESETVAEVSGEEHLGLEETRRNQAVLERFVSRIRSTSAPYVEASVRNFGEIAALSAVDASAALDLFQGQVEESDEFVELVHDIMAEVVARFAHLGAGNLHTHRKSSGWPDHWTYESEDRTDFLRQIRWFSSNFAPSFGRLLTPLVDGIRIMGPLFPTYSTSHTKMILLDGQGLGHTAESSASVTTHITRKFAAVDVILLVDNAQQPIQAAAQAVLRAAASSGHYEKLAVVFTHFDQVKGANLPTISAKKAHVLGSITNYLDSLKEVLSGAVVSAMSTALETQSFMLGGLQASSRKLPKGVVSELDRLTEFFESSVEPEIPAETHPIYDPAGIGFAVQKATATFHRHWATRLNLAAGRATPEHWTRVKALTRRIAGEIGVEYDTLTPVADLVGRMQEEISNFLDNPIAWTRPPISEEEAQASISAIRRDVYTMSHDVMLRRLISEYLTDWRIARDRSGKGSAHRRALDLKSIYELAAAVPGSVNSDPAISLLREVRAMVFDAVQRNGGELRLGT